MGGRVIRSKKPPRGFGPKKAKAPKRRFKVGDAVMTKMSLYKTGLPVAAGSLGVVAELGPPGRVRVAFLNGAGWCYEDALEQG
jgi:hypothetical protein